MKIVLINTICQKGSIGRICADLYEQLDRRGDTPYMIAGRGSIPSYMRGKVIGNKADFAMHVLKNFFQGKAGFGSAAVTKKLLAWLDEVQPDLIHLHNIHGFYLQTELLFDYLKKAGIPVVWTLHDCWPFTGHCAYFDYTGCDKWMEENGGCHDCPVHKSAYPYALFKDNTVWNYATKKRIFSGVPNLTIVVPSRWLKEKVAASFLKEYPVEVIYNGIDTDVFNVLDPKAQKLRDKQQAGYLHRRVLGVANYWEPRKGLTYLEQLSEKLPSNYMVEVVGLNKPQITTLLKKHPEGRFLPMPKTANPAQLAALYRTADVFVNPTLEDNFPTTNIEALACGTPVVTFRTGGSPEAIDEKTGIVVEKGDLEGLVAAVRKVCEEKPFSGPDCRQRGLLYTRGAFSLKYVELYEKMRYNNS
ncbi:MAG: glycosyltransferase [Lachnospiraceae bacterium]|nr:glycosyltransferase [Lachnospiraceae bacterium]